MRESAVFVLTFWLAAFAIPASADDVGAKLDQARGSYAKGDAIAALSAMQDAAQILTERLVAQFGKMLPPIPSGWSAGDIDSQPLDEAGGGLTVTRGYQKDESALNASLIIDNPAVATALGLFKPVESSTPPTDWHPVKINGEDWLLRFNKDMREGEVLAVLNSRALLQIEGTEITDSGILLNVAKGWNVPGIRKLLGS
jgi:hypothetical protein